MSRESLLERRGICKILMGCSTTTASISLAKSMAILSLFSLTFYDLKAFIYAIVPENDDINKALTGCYEFYLRFYTRCNF